MKVTVEFDVGADVVIWPANDRSDKVHSNNLYCVDRTLYLNTGTTQPGLLLSYDDGKTWVSRPIALSQCPPPPPSRSHDVAGFYVSSTGTLIAVHQLGDGFGTDFSQAPVYVSRSDDGGETWTSTEINYAAFAPAGSGSYTRMGVTGCHPNFIERPDGSLMFSSSMRYADWEDYQQPDQSRPGVRDVLIRSCDDGRSWGDPTVVHQHAAETAFAVDPSDPDHIIAASRIQRHALPGEDGEAIKRELTAVPYPASMGWVYKNGLLLESRDGGRSFAELPNSLFGFGAYRWSMSWTTSAPAAATDSRSTASTLVLVGNAGAELVPRPELSGMAQSDSASVVRLSLDGGATWVGPTPEGRSSKPREARQYAIAPTAAAEYDVTLGGRTTHFSVNYSDRLAATVRLPDRRFLTVYRYKR